jgi:hypothetical protein
LLADLTVLSLDDEETFVDECVDLLVEYSEYNLWIDPVIPVSGIKLGVVCTEIYYLYYNMVEEDGLDGTDDFEYFIARTS